MLDEAGQVVAVAGRREGAGHADQHHAAATEDVGGGARVEAVGRFDEELDLWQAVTGLDRHGILRNGGMRALV